MGLGSSLGGLAGNALFPGIGGGIGGALGGMLDGGAGLVDDETGEVDFVAWEWRDVVAWAQAYKDEIGAPNDGLDRDVGAKALARHAIPRGSYSRAQNAVAPLFTPQEGAMMYPHGYIDKGKAKSAIPFKPEYKASIRPFSPEMLKNIRGGGPPAREAPPGNPGAGTPGVTPPDGGNGSPGGGGKEVAGMAMGTSTLLIAGLAAILLIKR